MKCVDRAVSTAIDGALVQVPEWEALRWVAASVREAISDALDGVAEISDGTGTIVDDDIENIARLPR